MVVEEEEEVEGEVISEGVMPMFVPCHSRRRGGNI